MHSGPIEKALPSPRAFAALISPLPLLLALTAALATTPGAHAQTKGITMGPDFSKTFTPSTIGPGSISTITFTIFNDVGVPVTDLAFTDTLPAYVTVADPANASTNCVFDSGGGVTTPDASTISFSEGQVGAGETCTVTVDVTSGTAGMHTNPAITLSSSAGSSMSTAVDLTVDDGLPGFSKSFAPSSVPLGGGSTLTFTIDNTMNASPVGSLDFIDILPTGMIVADPANASTDCISTVFQDTTITAVPGSNVITLDANGDTIFPDREVLSAGVTCSVSVNVVATSIGMLDNVSGELLADSITCGKASATLDVTVTQLALTKSFTDDPVAPNRTGTLEFTITNFDRDFSATGVAMSDDLTTALAGLTFDSVESNTCLGDVTGEGTTSIDLSGGEIGPGTSCTLVVIVSVPIGAVPGAYVNTTGAVTGTVDGAMVTGNTASDMLFVEPVPIFTKEFIDDPVSAGDQVTLRFTITNTDLTTGLTDLDFTDDIGGVFEPRMGTLPFLAANSFVGPDTNAVPVADVCGAGSELSIFDPDDIDIGGTIFIIPADPTLLVFTGGSLAAAGSPGDSCTFDVVLDVPLGTPTGTYPNTTSDLTANFIPVAPPATDDLEIIVAPSLSKEFLDDPVPPDGTVTLEFTLTHADDAAVVATGITFTDDLALTLTGLTANLPPDPDPPCGAGSSLVGSAGNTFLTLMDGSLAPGASCTFRVTLDVPADAAPNNYTNTTSNVSAMVDGFAATSEPASDDLRIAGLEFRKEFVGDPVIAGETVTLRFTIENTSPTDDASGISFTDSLSAVLPGTPDLTVVPPLPTTPCGPSSSITGSTLLIFAGGELAQGDPPCTFDVTVEVPAGTVDDAYTNVTSFLSAVLGGVSVPGINPAVADLVVDSNRLQLVKEWSDDPVDAGDTANLRFTLTNLDANRTASAIAFTDDLGAVLPGLAASGLPFSACGGMVEAMPDASTISLVGGSLPPGGECHFDVPVAVPADTFSGTYANITSGLTGSMAGLAITGDPAIDDLQVFRLLEFSKSFDGPTVAGGTATLTFTITNPDSITRDNLAFFDDLDAVVSGLVATNLPQSNVCGSGSELVGTAFVTLTGASLPPNGGTCSFDVEVMVPFEADPGDFLNTSSDLFELGLPVAGPATATLTIEPPPAFDKEFSPNVVGNGFVSTLTFTIDNSVSSLAASDLDFTDNLPAGMVVATPSNAMTTCGGSVTAVAGSMSVSFTGGTVGAGASCTITVDVLTTETGFLSNTTEDLTSSSGNSGTAHDVLAVDPPPRFKKSFSPNQIAIDGTSTLTFHIENTFAVSDATGLDFTDNLPADVVIATPGNPSTDCTGGTLTAADGAGVITYTGATVGAGLTCMVEVDVTSSVVGEHENTSGELTSSLGSSGTARATLRVNPPPGFSKSFAPDPSIIDGIVTLTFIIDNTGSGIAATDLDFLDNLPAGLVVATPANPMSDCSGGTLTANEGATVISYSGGTVSAESFCTLSVDVTATVSGDFENVTGDLTSSLNNSGTATATLRVNPPPGFSKAFQPSDLPLGDVGTLVLSINNTSSTAEATDLDFIDNLPADVVIADPSNASTDCGGGILTADPGTTVIAYTGGIVPAMESCSVSVDITSSVLGPHVNTTGDLTSSLGNSGPAMATLTVVDLEGPAVTAVTTSNGELMTCDTLIQPVTSIDVTIEDTRTAVQGADASANYLLVGPGANGDFSTASCAGGVAGDDVQIEIVSLSLTGADPLMVTAELGLGGANGLAAGLYRFFVCDTITDEAGNALEGGDFQISLFRADPLNSLLNGNFDDCPVTLDPWTVTAVAPNVVQPGAAGTDDFAGSPLSTSVQIIQSDFETSSLSQCALVQPDEVFDFECWVRYVTPMGALAVFEKTCEFFDDTVCAGASLGQASIASLLEDNGGQWSFSETLVRTPLGAASARCTFQVGPLGSDPLFDVSLDGLFFGTGDQGLIFGDGFESGDTMAWSSTTP